MNAKYNVLVLKTVLLSQRNERVAHNSYLPHKFQDAYTEASEIDKIFIYRV
jgi:hypothetical protein